MDEMKGMQSWRFYKGLWNCGVSEAVRMEGWRREWDSNPRYTFTHTRFPSVRLKPLGHPSVPRGGK